MVSAVEREGAGDRGGGDITAHLAFSLFFCLIWDPSI